MTMTGRKHSDETRAKMSAASKGRPKSLEHRAKVSAALKGRTLPEDAPQRRKGRVVSEETRAKIRGFRHSEETKARISQAGRGRIVTEETRSKISDTLKGHEVSEAVRAVLREKNKLTAVANFRGGQIANDFASVLCPVGFVREHHVLWGKGNERFVLDFAHLEGKVNIELDGDSHDDTREQDALRDSLLTALGWRVIRIKV